MTYLCCGLCERLSQGACHRCHSIRACTASLHKLLSQARGEPVYHFSVRGRREKCLFEHGLRAGLLVAWRRTSGLLVILGILLYQEIRLGGDLHRNKSRLFVTEMLSTLYSGPLTTIPAPRYRQYSGCSWSWSVSVGLGWAYISYAWPRFTSTLILSISADVSLFSGLCTTLMMGCGLCSIPVE